VSRGHVSIVCYVCICGHVCIVCYVCIIVSCVYYVVSSLSYVSVCIVVCHVCTVCQVCIKCLGCTVCEVHFRNGRLKGMQLAIPVVRTTQKNLSLFKTGYYTFRRHDSPGQDGD